jgi:hypothetical protein
MQMKDYMRAMTKVVDGTEPQALRMLDVDGKNYFDPEYVQVYRNNSATAMGDVLRDRYMSVANLVGDEYFTHLVRQYMAEYPTNKRTLLAYGEQFPAFLTSCLEEHKLAYLVDFARLDWAWMRAHIAAEITPMEIEALHSYHQNGGDLEALQLALRPDVHVLTLSWPVFDIWHKLRAGHELAHSIDIDSQAQYVLIWRYHHEVQYKTLTAMEFVFLDTLKAGGSLGQATNLALLEGSPDEIGTLLPNMMDAELFSSPTRRE